MTRVIAAIVSLLMSFHSFGQKFVNVIDCQTMTSIMNYRVVKDFLHSHIDRIERCVFENNQSLLGSSSPKITCKSFDIESRNYRIFDSVGVAVGGYVPNQIIKISVGETDKAVLLYLEWMETGAEFQIVRAGKRYKVTLIRIDSLD